MTIEANFRLEHACSIASLGEPITHKQWDDASVKFINYVITGVNQ